MSDYIDRATLGIGLCNRDVFVFENKRYADGWNAAVKILIKAPAVDVQEVKHGKWMLEREPNGKPYCYHCSVCDNDYHFIGIKVQYRYCPNCGAKMDGGEADD